MATTTTNTDFTKMKIAESMIPGIFQADDDVDIFIQECNRYFDLCGFDDVSRNLVIKCLIKRELLPIYEAVPEKGQGFEKKLREAFLKPASMIEDFLELYNYEKDMDSSTIFFDKVEKMVKKLMKHSWTEEEVTAYFLVHCIKDKETKKEIRMREAKTCSEIKEVIRKVDAINVEVSGIAYMRKKETYANVLKSKQEYEDRQRQIMDRETRKPRHVTTENSYNSKIREMTCWTCNQHGHISRDCRQRRKQTCFTCGAEGHINRQCPQSRQIKEFCWGCKEEGHIRDRCPNISCSHCKRKGHLKFQCRDTRNTRQEFPNGHGFDRNQYGRRPQFSRDYVRDNYPHVRNQNIAAITSDDESIREKRYADDDDDAITRAEYPKVNAPSLDEMIGAMQ